jgi:DNA-binding transcriptional regulator LsrR (DeoR family)
MVNRMRDSRRPVADSVVQVIGGVGEPRAQVQATRLTEQLANLTGARPVFLPAPGFVSSAGLRQAILEEPYVKDASDAWLNLSILLAGIGSLDPSPLLKESGNAIPLEDQAELRQRGAIGDVCLRFFDEHGHPVKSGIDERVVGIPPEVLRTVPRRIGVAGGARKHAAIRAALLGGWVNVLVTDTGTARALLA